MEEPPSGFCFVSLLWPQDAEYLPALRPWLDSWESKFTQRFWGHVNHAVVSVCTFILPYTAVPWAGLIYASWATFDHLEFTNLHMSLQKKSTRRLTISWMTPNEHSLTALLVKLWNYLIPLNMKRVCCSASYPPVVLQTDHCFVFSKLRSWIFVKVLLICIS